MATELTSITITANDAEWLAEFIASLVDARLVACGNIIPGVRSIYAWKNQIQDETEVLAVLHTAADRVPEVIAKTVSEHPYDEPQVLAVPISAVSNGYRDWVLASTRSQ